MYKGKIESYLFAVYLDVLSIELNKVKAGCYIGEVPLNHLMFADDICVFFPSVHGLQCRIYLMCVWFMQTCMELFSTVAKLFE